MLLRILLYEKPESNKKKNLEVIFYFLEVYVELLLTI